MKKIHSIKRPETLKGIAYARIKALLTNGELKFDKIYSANLLAENMGGVSRTPVREALLQLCTEGYLIPIKERGFAIRKFSEKEVRDFFEVRRMIEVHVIKRLIRLLTEQDLKQLEEALSLMIKRAAEADRPGFLEADRNFHMSLIQRYNNFLWESIMDNVRNMIAIYGQKTIYQKGRTDEIINEHKNIVQALYQKDRKKAVDAMKRHLYISEKYLLESLKKDWDDSL